MKRTFVSWEVFFFFFLTLTHKYSEDSKQSPPLSEVPQAFYRTELYGDE